MKAKFPDLYRLPHARGGVSATEALVVVERGSSPRPWGCFHGAWQVGGAGAVFPTPVGVFPSASVALVAAACLPHARGGVSVDTLIWSYVLSSSPRPWGCFSWLACMSCQRRVFPTPVGVFLAVTTFIVLFSGLPHARGGVSALEGVGRGNHQSSPRPWGCFLEERALPTLRRVFPTPVGVFLPPLVFLKARFRLPHARGGVSAACPIINFPRPVFPTPVGVFPLYKRSDPLPASLPHARGGVSSMKNLR